MKIRMRELSQFVIATDQFRYRYDILAGFDGKGMECGMQFCKMFDGGGIPENFPPPDDHPGIVAMRKEAATAFAKILAERELDPTRLRDLVIPTGIDWAHMIDVEV